jgi:hypothetical protein
MESLTPQDVTIMVLAVAIVILIVVIYLHSRNTAAADNFIGGVSKITSSANQACSLMDPASRSQCLKSVQACIPLIQAIATPTSDFGGQAARVKEAIPPCVEAAIAIDPKAAAKVVATAIGGGVEPRVHDFVTNPEVARAVSVAASNVPRLAKWGLSVAGNLPKQYSYRHQQPGDEYVTPDHPQVHNCGQAYC